jgi:hypothetical protein
VTANKHSASIGLQPNPPAAIRGPADTRKTAILTVPAPPGDRGRRRACSVNIRPKRFTEKIPPATPLGWRGTDRSSVPRAGPFAESLDATGVDAACSENDGYSSCSHPWSRILSFQMNPR